jgi:hypothetical protein
MMQAQAEVGMGEVVPMARPEAAPAKKAPRKRTTQAATAVAKPRRLPTTKVVSLSKSDVRTLGQFIAAIAAGFLPLASYILAHVEAKHTPGMWVLVAAALMFSAPTLVEWAQKWCKSVYKAAGFTCLLEGVMVFSGTQWLALCGLAILMGINCVAAWGLAGKSAQEKKPG